MHISTCYDDFVSVSTYDIRRDLLQVPPSLTKRRCQNANKILERRRARMSNLCLEVAVTSINVYEEEKGIQYCLSSETRLLSMVNISTGRNRIASFPLNAVVLSLLSSIRVYVWSSFIHWLKPGGKIQFQLM